MQQKLLLNRIIQHVEGEISVFIDAANIELSAKDKRWRVDYKKLFKWLNKIGKVTYIGFFTVRFETKPHDGFLTILKKTGYKLVTKPLKVIKSHTNRDHIRKANFDVEISVEAIKQVDSFQTMILFSGDSDFNYLLRELKKKNKRVIVVSMKHHIAKELIEVADLYIDLRQIKKEIERK